jgi:hypothetical protein
VGFTVVQELLLDPEPGRPCCGAIVLVDDVQEVSGNGVENLGDNHALHA